MVGVVMLATALLGVAMVRANEVSPPPPDCLATSSCGTESTAGAALLQTRTSHGAIQMRGTQELGEEEFEDNGDDDAPSADIDDTNLLAKLRAYEEAYKAAGGDPAFLETGTLGHALLRGKPGFRNYPMKANSVTNVNTYEQAPAPNCSNMGPVPPPLTKCPGKGKLYEGACWYQDKSPSQLFSCNEVCERKGLIYDPMTRYVAGDCGSAYQCSQVGHLFEMPGDANNLWHEYPGSKKRQKKKMVTFNSHPCMGCLIYDRGVMKQGIVDFDGDWWQQYAGQGVAWMPGVKWTVGGEDSHGTSFATDARCSANMGPPTRVCACRSTAELNEACGDHSDCESTYCDGIVATPGAKSGLVFTDKKGTCKTLAENGQSCSSHQGCKSGYCSDETCAAVTWDMENGAVTGGTGRISSPWCLTNGPDGCALVVSMSGADPPRGESIQHAKRLCAMIPDCNAIWCCTTGCTNAVCYGTSATTPNYRKKDCPGLKGSFLESKIPVQLFKIKRPSGQGPVEPAPAPEPEPAPTVPRPFEPVTLDWTDVSNPKKECLERCKAAGLCSDFCGPRGACCKLGFIDWSTGSPSAMCSDAIVRSALGNDNKFGELSHICVPRSHAPPGPMTDAETGEKLTFLPASERFKLQMCPKKEKKWCAKNAPKYQVLLNGYQCGPPTSTFAKTYHDHPTSQEAGSIDESMWYSASQCLVRCAKKGAKAMLWTNGWRMREQGMLGYLPPYNCACEKTQDIKCPEGFTKVKHKGEWKYVEILPKDAPDPKIEVSLMLSKMIPRDDLRTLLAQCASVDVEEIEVLEEEPKPEGGILVHYAASVEVAKLIDAQVKDSNSAIWKSELKDVLAYGQDTSPTPSPPKRGKGRKGSRKGGKGRR